MEFREAFYFLENFIFDSDTEPEAYDYVVKCGHCGAVGGSSPTKIGAMVSWA
jgi:hypothetical protein